MPTSLVCNSLDILFPVITRIVNISLSTSYFPSDWKKAILKPLLKKVGADSAEYTNLRLVSNLQFISKVNERAVFDQLYVHMTISLMKQVMKQQTDLEGSKRIFDFLSQMALPVAVFISDRHRSIVKWIRECRKIITHIMIFGTLLNYQQVVES